MPTMSDAKSQKAVNFSKVWNLPNILTYGRILAVPLVAGLLMWDTNAARWIALALFVAAAITDFFDGYLARKWQQQSSLGRMLDPIADKVLVAVVLLVLAGSPILYGGHMWAAIIILSREVLVSGLREYLGELQVSVPVTKIAKWKTTVQLVALGLLIAAPMLLGLAFIGHLLLWVAAALTVWTGWEYLRSSWPHLMGPA